MQVQDKGDNIVITHKTELPLVLTLSYRPFLCGGVVLLDDKLWMFIDGGDINSQRADDGCV